MKLDWLDRLHGAFRTFSRETKSQEEQWSLSVLRQGNGPETLDVVVTDCEIDTDWIEAIEQTLPFLDNAIRQSRQFIQRQGETVPIVKAKQVSRASVEHLSRNSQLISAVPEPEEPLVPEKLYVTEHVGTYAVYENRFLYMLLRQVRDFTATRYEQIRQAAGACAKLFLEKQYTQDGRKVTVSLNYTENTAGSQENAQTLERIRQILQNVELLLRSGLMQEVAHAPLLRPPVVRNNVMLHDRNFVAAFELYSYLEGYWEPGFRVVERCRKTGPFSESTRLDMAKWLELTAYLPYGAGLQPILEERWLQEEQRREAQLLQQRRDALIALKAKIGHDQDALLAYMLALENHNQQLEQNAASLIQEQMDHQQTRESLADAQRQQRRMEGQIQQLQGKLQAQIQHQQNMQMQYNRELDRQKTEFENQMTQLQQQCGVLEEQCLVAKARCHAAGQMDQQALFTSPEGFAALEAELQALQRLYERQWKLAKKQIRKEHLWKKKGTDI